MLGREATRSVAICAHNAGFADIDHLGCGVAQAGGFEIRPGLLGASAADLLDVQAIRLGEGYRNRRFDPRCKSGQEGDGGGNESGDRDLVCC